MCVWRKGFIGWGWDSGTGKVVGAGRTNVFSNTTVNRIKCHSREFDCIDLASTVAGTLSLFVGCFCLNVGNDDELGESFDAYDELSSLSWNGCGGGAPKVESGGKSWCLLDDWPDAEARFRARGP